MHTRSGHLQVALLVWLLLTAAAAAAQPLPAGAAFPRLEAETLAETTVALPDAAAGAPAVVVFSFSRGGAERAQPWTDALRRRLANGTATVWSVASLQGAPRFIRGVIRGGMRKQAPESAHGRVLCLYTDDALWRQRLKVTDKDLPVIVALDASGRITTVHRGPYDETAMTAVLAHVARDP